MSVDIRVCGEVFAAVETPVDGAAVRENHWFTGVLSLQGLTYNIQPAVNEKNRQHSQLCGEPEALYS